MQGKAGSSLQQPACEHLQWHSGLATLGRMLQDNIGYVFMAVRCMRTLAVARWPCNLATSPMPALDAVCETRCMVRIPARRASSAVETCTGATGVERSRDVGRHPRRRGCKLSWNL